MMQMPLWRAQQSTGQLSLASRARVEELNWRVDNNKLKLLIDSLEPGRYCAALIGNLPCAPQLVARGIWNLIDKVGALGGILLRCAVPFIIMALPNGLLHDTLAPLRLIN